jgi:predicted regulator of Ras-like GTPase activity (Roadblock/LC7/MglB family)
MFYGGGQCCNGGAETVGGKITKGSVYDMAQPAHKIEQDGFVGEVSGMSLADIIQVKGNNRDSGCLVIEHLGKSGMIFLREGEVVHAEQGALSGEDAFYAIMGWAGGSFRTEPKVATTSRSINQVLGFLLLEAFRRIDEAKHISQTTPKAVGNSGKEAEGVSDINVKLKAIPEVEQALIITKDGAVVDDTSYEAEFLGAHALFLSQFAGQIGSQFGVGEVKSVTVHGTEHHLFLFDSKRHHLLVSAKGSGNVNALDGEIRRTLAQK